MSANQFKKQQDIRITKLIFNKVFRDEFKPVHQREMVLDTSYKNMGYLSEALYYKGTSTITQEDLMGVPSLITLSDVPSANPIMVNGGWNEDRYSFMMEITIWEDTGYKNLYLSGYTDKDDLFSLSGHINPDINLIFNDCLVTQTIFVEGRIPITRIISNLDILPNPEDDYRDTTLRPSDCFTIMQGEEEVGMYCKENDSITYSDGRLINKGGKIANKLVTSLDNHLTKVANDYIYAGLKAIDNESASEVLGNAVWDGRERMASSTIDLFNLICSATGVIVTNYVSMQNLLAVAPMHFEDPSRDYVVKDKRHNDRVDEEIHRLSKHNSDFRALSTTDSESTAVISVETKIAQMLLSELNALMSTYKIKKLAISATNYEKDFDNEPIVIISNVSTIVNNTEINKALVDSFEVAFKKKIFNKISFADEVAVSMIAYIGFNVEKVEVAVNGKEPVVISQPTYMSSAFSPLVGTFSELKTLSSSYKTMFATLNGNITALKEAGYTVSDELTPKKKIVTNLY